MITTMQKKIMVVNQPCEIESELRQIFGEAGPASIIDIGACDGLSSIQYARIFPGAKILAVEPRMDNCNEAAKNIQEFGFSDRINLLNVALGEKTLEQAPFYESYGQADWVKDWDTGNKSSSALPPKDHQREHPWCFFRQSVCKMATLDFFCGGIVIDFIHIDVQGYELNVFKGGEETLKHCRAIWCEVSNIELYEGQPLKKDIVAWLGERGFRVMKDTCGDKKFGDVLFVKG